MKDIILETNCLLGVHRLLSSINNIKFNKIILPPEATLLAWPNEIWLTKYLRNNPNSLSILLQERDNVLELIEKLKGLGRLETPSQDDWYKKVTDNSKYLDVKTHLLKASLKNNQDLGLINPDYDAFTLAFVTETPIEYFNPIIKTFIEEQFESFTETKNIELEVPSEMKSENIEEYLEKGIIKNTKDRISKIFKKQQKIVVDTMRNLSGEIIKDLIPGSNVATTLLDGLLKGKNIYKQNILVDLVNSYKVESTTEKVMIIESAMNPYNIAKFNKENKKGYLD